MTDESDDDPEMWFGDENAGIGESESTTETKPAIRRRSSGNGEPAESVESTGIDETGDDETGDDETGDDETDGATPARVNVERRWERVGVVALLLGIVMAAFYAWLFLNGVRSPDPVGGFIPSVLVALVGFALTVGFRVGRIVRWLASGS